MLTSERRCPATPPRSTAFGPHAILHGEVRHACFAAKVTRKRATYQSVLDAPPHKVAEIIDGTLSLQPRPAGPHAE